MPDIPQALQQERKCEPQQDIAGETADEPVSGETGPGQILIQAEQWFTQAMDADALEMAWTEFEYLQEQLGEDDAQTLRNLYYLRLQELQPDTQEAR